MILFYTWSAAERATHCTTSYYIAFYIMLDYKAAANLRLLYDT